MGEMAWQRAPRLLMFVSLNIMAGTIIFWDMYE
ncbi:hypothetical protein T260_09610 [Geobacillus thermopakistaniensis]|uniref:Uncharacterized protein n=1 Tax=Geobacillus thermopakistaniensis (strain MAS1) TaxID=1408282 RepID=A0A7U9JB10_GEOTM|nr:hypothetical protein GA8_04380 [Geobacillus sp. A8]ESU72157.1 hypothetical protein T260_09610 [Geobacillus sp. MAS1]